MARIEQAREKDMRMAEQAKQERDEFLRIIEKQKEEQENERRIEEEKRKVRLEHADKLRWGGQQLTPEDRFSRMRNSSGSSVLTTWKRAAKSGRSK